MFQAQNRETKLVLEKLLVLQDHYDDERDKDVFRNTTPDLQDQDQDRFFFGLRPVLSQGRRSQTTSMVIWQKEVTLINCLFVILLALATAV